jgi:hypothetical protein
MEIEKTKVEKYREEITVEEYGELIAEKIYSWYLQEPTINGAKVNDLTCDELTLLVKSIVDKICSHCNVSIYDLIKH